jgi:predicted esterase
MADERHITVRRTARYYTLGPADGSPRQVWFVLHGYGQLASQFVRVFEPLDDGTRLIVAPEALNKFYLVAVDTMPAADRPVGATWMTREDRASEIADYVEYLDALFDDVAADASRAGARVNVIGFSQGTATATRWVTHGRATLHRLILWGGLIPPETDLTRGPQAFRHSRLTLVVGSRDHYVSDAMLGAEQARLDAAAIPYDVIRFDGGHAINRSVFEQLNGSGTTNA